MNPIIKSLIENDNHPSEGIYEFDSSDHVRFQNGQAVSGHNYGCNRRISIEKNINGGEGFTVTIYNLDSIHPLWGNNVQMAPKQMRIIKSLENVVELRGFGKDRLGATFSDYGILVMIESNEIVRVQLNMIDRNTSIVYLK